MIFVSFIQQSGYKLINDAVTEVGWNRAIKWLKPSKLQVVSVGDLLFCVGSI